MADKPLKSITFPGLTDKYTIPEIDSTLTQQGEAADAKKTGDEISGLKNTLNHKADAIYDTASGDIASFPDGADGLPVKDLTVAIEPVQSGTGDPSPTNVRPISGWTGAKVTKCGKNLIDDSIKYQYNETVVVVGANNYDFTIFLKAGQYTLSANFLNGVHYGAFVREQNDTSNRTIWISDGTDTTGTFTLSSDGLYRFWFYKGDGAIASNIEWCQLELGSTATAYEPYAGTTLPISWQSSAGTVYGGTLDVTSGVLTVDRAGVRLNTLTFDAHPTVTNVFYTTSLEGRKLGVTNIISDMFAATDTSVASLPIGGMRGLTNNKTLYFGYQAANVSAFMAAVDNSILVYELATPVTYQLTPAEVTTLLGQNNIWADTGDSTVEYPADTKLYIQKINTPTDDDMIADANIASGKYFIVNNNLYISTAAILAGDPIKPGTNCTLTNLAAALNAINS